MSIFNRCMNIKEILEDSKTNEGILVSIIGGIIVALRFLIV